MTTITFNKAEYENYKDSLWFQQILEFSDEITIVIHMKEQKEELEPKLSETVSSHEGSAGDISISHSIWWELHRILEPYDQFIAIFLAVSLGIFTEFAVDTFYHPFVAYIGIGFFILALLLSTVAVFEFFQIRRRSYSNRIAEE